MQGYHKNSEEKKLSNKLEQFLIKNNIFFIKNYGSEVNQYSNPDYSCCVFGKYVCIELDNYLQEGKKPKMNPIILHRINKSKGTLLSITKQNFKQVTQAILDDIKYRKQKEIERKHKLNRLKQLQKNKAKKVQFVVKKKPAFLQKKSSPDTKPNGFNTLHMPYKPKV